MEFIDNLTRMINIFLVIMIVLAAIFFSVMFYLRKQKKGRGLAESEMDYSSFEREDSESYVQFDDIRDGMIICDGGTRFVGAISVYGFDFYHASPELQAQIQQNFVGFINTITTPTTYRQYSKAVDLEHTLEIYQKAYQNLELQLFDAVEDLRDIENALRVAGELEQEQSILYERRIKELKTRKESLEWRRQHMRDEIAYIKRSSGGNVAPERMQTWVFDWSYNPASFTMNMTKEQIYKRALNEVSNCANTKIDALQKCHVRAVRCTTEDLIEMTRRYSSPISANRFPMRSVLKSSFFEDINVDTNHAQMVQDALESINQKGSLSTGQLVKAATKKQTVMMPKNLKNLGASDSGSAQGNVKNPVRKEQPAKIPEVVEQADSVYSGGFISNIEGEPSKEKEQTEMKPKKSEGVSVGSSVAAEPVLEKVQTDGERLNKKEKKGEEKGENTEYTNKKYKEEGVVSRKKEDKAGVVSGGTGKKENTVYSEKGTHSGKGGNGVSSKTDHSVKKDSAGAKKQDFVEPKKNEKRVTEPRRENFVVKNGGSVAAPVGPTNSSGGGTGERITKESIDAWFKEV